MNPRYVNISNILSRPQRGSTMTFTSIAKVQEILKIKKVLKKFLNFQECEKRTADTKILSFKKPTYDGPSSEKLVDAVLIFFRNMSEPTYIFQPRICSS